MLHLDSRLSRRFNTIATSLILERILRLCIEIEIEFSGFDIRIQPMGYRKMHLLHICVADSLKTVKIGLRSVWVHDFSVGFDAR